MCRALQFIALALSATGVMMLVWLHLLTRLVAQDRVMMPGLMGHFLVGAVLAIAAGILGSVLGLISGTCSGRAAGTK